MARSNDLHGTDDYLEAVYELYEEGVEVVQARLAERLGVSRAAVSEKVQRLVGMKLIEVDRGRRIVLTSHGRAVAEEAVRRHRMAERFLIDVLKLPWHKAHEEAGRFQDAISGEIEEAAAVDGATGTRFNFRIVLPLMVPTIMGWMAQ